MNSDSDEVGSGFIDGLKELGLYTDTHDDTEEVKKPKGQKKGKRTGRGLPKKKPLDFDALMDGLDIDDHKPEAKPQNDVKMKPTVADDYQVPLFKRDSPIVAVEQSIGEYLQRAVKILVNEFHFMLNDLLSGGDDIMAQTEEWLEDLKQSVREELQVIQTEAYDSEITRVLNGVELVDPEFKEVFQMIEQQKSVSVPNQLREVRQLQVSVTSLLQSMKQQLNYDSVVNEMRDLNNVRTTYFAKMREKSKTEKAHANLLLDLEAEQTRQTIEGEAIEQKLTGINEERARMEETELYDVDNDGETLESKLETLIRSLQNHIHDLRDSRELKRYLNALDDARDDCSSTRRMYAYRLNQVIQALRELPMNSSVAVVSQSIPMGSFAVARDPLMRSAVPMNSTVSAAPVSVDPTSDSLLANAREKLKQFQQRRESYLEEATQFLSSIRKQEKKRLRDLSKPQSPDLEMNTLFMYK